MKKSFSLILTFGAFVFLAGCDSSNKVDSTSSSAAPAASPAGTKSNADVRSAATISASPNPVPAGEGPGTTTVKWSTGDALAGQVYVLVDGSGETLFAAAADGQMEAPWIQTDHVYEFRLFAGTEHTKLLAQTQVTRAK